VQERDMSVLVRVVLPAHLRTLARVAGEVKVEVAGPVTLAGVLDALETTYPMLRGTIRDQVTRQRRAWSPVVGHGLVPQGEVAVRLARAEAQRTPHE